MTFAKNIVSRLLHTISAGRITVVNDTGPVQVLQVSERPGTDGTPALTDGVLRVAQFGFTSNPPLQAETVLVRLWGNRTLTICVGSNHQPSRLKNLNSGDAALYDQRGAYVWLQPSGLVINAAGAAVTIQNFSSCTIKGDLHVTGDVIADSAGAAISLVKHPHPIAGPGAPETGSPLPISS